jgi:hypothetical protein
MQTASDLFLGWTVGPNGRHYYIRQLRDVKIKPLVEVYHPQLMSQYASACGWALARAHARSGDPAQIAGYLGSNNRFEESLADFAESYADQNDRDHAAFVEAVGAGRIEVYMER